MAPFRDRDAELTEANIKTSKAAFKKQKEIQMAELPLDSSDSDDTLAEELDDGDEFVPDEPVTQPVIITKRRKESAQEIIVSQPETEDFEAANEPQVPIVARRITRSSTKPRKVATAQPENSQQESRQKTVKKGRARRVRLYH